MSFHSHVTFPIPGLRNVHSHFSAIPVGKWESQFPIPMQTSSSNMEYSSARCHMNFSSQGVAICALRIDPTPAMCQMNSSSQHLLRGESISPTQECRVLCNTKIALKVIDQMSPEFNQFQGPSKHS